MEVWYLGWRRGLFTSLWAGQTSGGIMASSLVCAFWGARQHDLRREGSVLRVDGIQWSYVAEGGSFAAEYIKHCSQVLGSGRMYFHSQVDLGQVTYVLSHSFLSFIRRHFEMWLLRLILVWALQIWLYVCSLLSPSDSSRSTEPGQAEWSGEGRKMCSLGFASCRTWLPSGLPMVVKSGRAERKCRFCILF